MTDHNTLTDGGEQAEFVLLAVDGRARYGRRASGESTYQAIRACVPDLGTQGAGVLRLWFADMFGPDLAPNRLADRVVDQLGYRHPTGWYGPVVVSMEGDPITGAIPPLSPDIRAIIDELVAQRV